MNNFLHKKRSRSTCRGVSLIEVAVTMTLLLVGILGTLKLQATSLKSTYSTFQRNLAAVQAQDLVERLWAGICVQSVSSTRASIVSEWQAQHNPEGSLKSSKSSVSNLQMSGWSGALNTLTSNVYEVVIDWTDAASGESLQYKLYTSLPGC